MTADASAAPPTPQGVAKRSGRPRAVVLVLLLAVLTLGSGRVTWVQATVDTALGVRPLSVSGAQVTALTGGLGLCMAAAAIAFSLAGRVARIVVGVVVAACGVALTVSAVTCGLDPTEAVRGAAVESFSVDTIASATITAWVPGVGVLGVAILAAGIALIGLRVADGRAARFEAPTSAGSAAAAPARTNLTPQETDADAAPGDLWAALSAGSDPTDDPDLGDPDRPTSPRA